MKRQIIIKLFGDEIVNILIDESEDETEELDETESINALNSDSSSSGRGSIGFGTPWSVDYWDSED